MQAFQRCSFNSAEVKIFSSRTLATSQPTETFRIRAHAWICRDGKTLQLWHKFFLRKATLHVCAQSNFLSSLRPSSSHYMPRSCSSSESSAPYSPHTSAHTNNEVAFIPSAAATPIEPELPNSLLQVPKNGPQQALEGTPSGNQSALQSLLLSAGAALLLAVLAGLQLHKRVPKSLNNATRVSVTANKSHKVMLRERKPGRDQCGATLPATTIGSTDVSADIPQLHGKSDNVSPSLPFRRSRSRSHPTPHEQVTLVSTKVTTTTSDKSSSQGTAQLAQVDEKDLRDWMQGLKEEARQRGVIEKVIKRALKGIRPVPQVIEKDRNQPEFKLTYEDYFERMVTDHRIKLGVDMMMKHRPLLQEVSAKYGVPESIIVAIWGMESSYGNFMGTWDVVAALVTLAYDKEQPSRAKYFREELINSLFILQEGHAAFDTMRGSWAGAMGQCQFMPSSFRNFAVDFDGDGKADIWTSPADVFASIANYLAKHGWKTGEPYFEKVAIPKELKRDLLGLTVKKPAGEWRETHGVKTLVGPSVLPSACLASLVVADGPSSPCYMASHNLLVVLRYNKSVFYALVVGHIADCIETGAKA